MALEVSLRALIPFLLVATLMVGGCDRAKPGAEQASGALADANQASPDDVAASPDEVAPGGASAEQPGEVERSHQGARAEERRVGNECVRQCRSRRATYH